MTYGMLLYVIRINAMEINRSVCRHVQTVRHSLPDASDASTRAFTLQSQAAANRSRPLRTPPDVVSVYRTNPTQWTQCVHGQPAANRSRTVRASGKIASVYTAYFSKHYNHCFFYFCVFFCVDLFYFFGQTFPGASSVVIEPF